jgi:hypothetical protein
MRVFCLLINNAISLLRHKQTQWYSEVIVDQGILKEILFGKIKKFWKSNTKQTIVIKKVTKLTCSNK